MNLTENPWEMVRAADRAVARERARLHEDPNREGTFWLHRLTELDQQRPRAQEVALRSLLDYDELGAKLSQLEVTIYWRPGAPGGRGGCPAVGRASRRARSRFRRGA